MTGFTIEGFAEGCKNAMNNAEDRRQAARKYLQQTLNDNDPQQIIDTLNAAIPAGADIGEMIVHQSPELTMLYARVPAHFQSGIHNHTVFACIGQLSGEEVGVSYAPADDGKGLQVIKRTRSQPGQVASLPADAIHHIENPGDETASALHIYGGDFGAVMEQRSLWSSHDHQEMPFNFQQLVAESAKAMKLNDNQKGLDALVQAIPAAKPLVDSL